MLRAPSDDNLSQTVLDFLTRGAYPESEDVAAAEFPASAAPIALQHISKAREEAEVFTTIPSTRRHELTGTPQSEICELSRQYAPGVDGWISQARNLHKDIERSRLTAREIVAQHEKGESLRGDVADASAKLKLLKSEIAYNRELMKALEEVRSLDNNLNSARDVLQEGQVPRAIESLEYIETAIRHSQLPTNSYVAGILSTKASDLRRSITENLHERWNSQVSFDRKSHRLTIASNDQGKICEALRGETDADIPARSVIRPQYDHYSLRKSRSAQWCNRRLGKGFVYFNHWPDSPP